MTASKHQADLHASYAAWRITYQSSEQAARAAYARVQELEAQLEAIGAGGVEPLRRRECLHQIAEPAPAHQEAHQTAPVRDYPPLPVRRRAFICTKCGGRECEPETLNKTHPSCKCGYLGFAEDLDFTADDMRAYVDADRAMRVQAAREEIKCRDTQEAAIGAGGVEPLRPRQCLHKIRERGGWVAVSDRLPATTEACDWLMPPTELKRERWILVNECIVTASVHGSATHWRKTQPLPPSPSSADEVGGK